MPTDDYTSAVNTRGRLTVGRSARGRIDLPGDVDWFRVTLRAGVTYRIDLEAQATNKGTIRDPFLAGIYTSTGSVVSGSTFDNDSGTGNNAQLTFRPTTAGNYFIGATAILSSIPGGSTSSLLNSTVGSVLNNAVNQTTGTYTLSIRQTSRSKTTDYVSQNFAPFAAPNTPSIASPSPMMALKLAEPTMAMTTKDPLPAQNALGALPACAQGYFLASS